MSSEPGQWYRVLDRVNHEKGYVKYLKRDFYFFDMYKQTVELVECAEGSIVWERLNNIRVRDPNLMAYYK